MMTNNIPKWVSEVITNSSITEDKIREWEVKLAATLQKDTPIIMDKIQWLKNMTIDVINAMNSMGCYPVETYDCPIAVMWVADQMIEAFKIKDYRKLAALYLILIELMDKSQDYLKEILENYHDYYLNR